MKVKHVFKYNPPMGIYHPSSGLTAIVNDPVYLSETLWLCKITPDKEGKKEITSEGYPDVSFSTEHHIIDYSLWNHTLVMDRGQNKSASSTKPHLITRSLSTLKDIVNYRLSRDANITHIQRNEYRSDEDFKKTSSKIDVYQFEPEGRTIFGRRNKN